MTAQPSAAPSAIRYAKALFSLAAEGRQQAAVAAAAAGLAPALNDPAIAAAIANPRLTPAQRKSFAASMAKAVKAPAVLADTLGVLAANNRLAVVPGVLAHYQQLHDAAEGTTRVRIASATPLTEAQRSKISALLKTETKATAIRLEETTDASLQGGFRAFFNGKVWDASLSGALSRLGTRLRTAVAQRH